MHFLLAGLGNSPYPLTRHSVGHLIVDSLASRLGISLRADRSTRGLLATKADVDIGSQIVTLTLYKPKALMNISGKPVADAMRFLSVSPSETIVIHDSLSHKPMSMSPKFGGSANGHNGVRSIVSALGNNMDFHRLRAGIGRDESDAARYVLGPLSPAEREFWGPNGAGIELVWRGLTKIVTGSR
ncbi:hypothetical protein IEO21_08387 [Rhodonia placenta]|uniref:peptidyl-tRNA hydrolase n=2 Tax=Rhodonia placenta TaxID=104341 RepID=A0A1X6NC50_9APHY|nr:hypothetical protein POSPLADRAFT_1038494 [Postia placenta MAD-698-R-SB12]KAF9807097.1 hypothetical protein IEO21_08387 [Postia placenta]OSX66072.1 hypothetical protein POSPLADRAFT_1038494 [Postia placenta MAD-698-R-SB12]